MQSHLILNAQKELAKRRRLDGVDAPLSTDIKPINKPVNARQDAPKITPKRDSLPTRVKVYPTLALAFYKHFPAVGRVYDLLKAYDLARYGGRGFISRDDARELLTGGGRWRCMSWRRLRQVLTQGEGKIWEQHENGNIQLFSPARVAVGLDAGSLRGQPVWIDIQQLTTGIQSVRAAQYSAAIAGQTKGNPITRQSLRQLTSVPERTQQIYDKVVGTKQQVNYAVGSETYSKDNRQRRSWEHGKGTFKFIDWSGKHGRKRTAHVAWRLPNSYEAKLETAPKGRQRKHNKKINLVNIGTRDNGSDCVRIYHPFAAQAAKAVSAERPEQDHYYSVGGAYMTTAATRAKLMPVSTWGVMSCV